MYTWFQIFVACCALVAIGWVVGQQLFGLRLLAVQTGSMRPTFNPGDAVIVAPVELAKLHIGEIVSYHSPRNLNELITHRVVALGTQGFQTKGDRLSLPDPAVRNALLAGKVTATLPGLGRILNWLRSWPGLVSAIYIPATIIGGLELHRLEQHYRRLQPYRLSSRQVVS